MLNVLFFFKYDGEYTCPTRFFMVMKQEINKRYRVKDGWEVVYANPLSFKKGELIRIDKQRSETNPEWHGWVWGSNSLSEGWFPDSFVNIQSEDGQWRYSIAMRDYSGREVAVSIGEYVTLLEVVCGWAWVSHSESSESGWIPLSCLEKTA